MTTTYFPISQSPAQEVIQALQDTLAVKEISEDETVRDVLEKAIGLWRGVLDGKVPELRDWDSVRFEEWRRVRFQAEKVAKETKSDKARFAAEMVSHCVDGIGTIRGTLAKMYLKKIQA